MLFIFDKFGCQERRPGLLSTREGRPFALSRVAQKHDMRAGTTMDAHSPETDNNNNLRKKKRPKLLLLPRPAGAPAGAPPVTRAENPGGGQRGIPAKTDRRTCRTSLCSTRYDCMAWWAFYQNLTTFARARRSEHSAVSSLQASLPQPTQNYSPQPQ